MHPIFMHFRLKKKKKKRFKSALENFASVSGHLRTALSGNAINLFSQEGYFCQSLPADRRGVYLSRGIKKKYIQILLLLLPKLATF